MVGVYNGKDPKETREDLLHYRQVVARKWTIRGRWKDLFIVDLVLHPGHYEIYILSRGASNWVLYFDAIGP